jgi:hypothetical protein
MTHHHRLRQTVRNWGAPGTSERICSDAIRRGDGETDGAHAKRQELLTELWSIPDSP